MQPPATAAAEPPLDPPGTRSGSAGFRTGKNAEFSLDEPMANSSQFVLPTITAPASSTRLTAVALYGATKFSRARDAQVVFSPSVMITSLTASGTPPSGPMSRPAAIRASTRSAAASARPGVKLRNTPESPLPASQVRRASCASSRALNRPSSRPCRTDSIVSFR